MPAEHSIAACTAPDHDECLHANDDHYFARGAEIYASLCASLKAGQGSDDSLRLAYYTACQRVQTLEETCKNFPRELSTVIAGGLTVAQAANSAGQAGSHLHAALEKGKRECTRLARQLAHRNLEPYSGNLLLQDVKNVVLQGHVDTVAGQRSLALLHFRRIGGGATLPRPPVHPDTSAEGPLGGAGATHATARHPGYGNQAAKKSPVYHEPTGLAKALKNLNVLNRTLNPETATEFSVQDVLDNELWYLQLTSNPLSSGQGGPLQPSNLLSHDAVQFMELVYTRQRVKEEIVSVQREMIALTAVLTDRAKELLSSAEALLMQAASLQVNRCW
jgi:hypothetical protein